MINRYTFSVLGGDRRMLYAAEMLSKTGFPVFTFGLSGAPTGNAYACDSIDDALHADFILLPIPMSRDGKTLFAPALKKPLLVEMILEKSPCHALLFGGKTSAFSDHRLFDYGARSDFASANAVPTAEGALLLAIQHLSRTVNGSHIGIVGFGRVGKAVASLFHAAGAKVTVFARREEVCAVAAMLGYHAAPIRMLPEHAEEIHCLINTAPAPILGEEVLSRMAKSTLMLELASPPYGVDFETAEKLGLKAILADGLPGKYAPEAAGGAICKTVLSMLCEKGISL